MLTFLFPGCNLIMKIKSNHGNILVRIVYILCVALLAILIYNSAIKNNYVENAYEYANLDFETKDAIEQSSYATRKDNSNFYFFANAPNTARTKLIFHRTSVVKFKVRPLYEGPSCTEIGRDKATLVVDTPVSYIRKLLDKPEIEFTITVVAGDALLIRVNNPKEQQCGQAMVRLLRDSATPQLFFVAGYALVWLAVGLLLVQFRMGSLGIWGAVIHASYIYSETLYQQILSIEVVPKNWTGC